MSVATHVPLHCVYFCWLQTFWQQLPLVYASLAERHVKLTLLACWPAVPQFVLTDSMSTQVPDLTWCDVADNGVQQEDGSCIE